MRNGYFPASFHARLLLCAAALAMLVLLARVVYAAEISGVTVGNITDGGATISWKTDVETDATINYGLDSSVGIVRDADFNKKEHSLNLTNLDPNTTYHFRVISSDEVGNKSATAGLVFTTKGTQAQKVIKDLKEIKKPEDLEEVIQEVQNIADDLLRPPSIIGLPNVEFEGEKVIITWKSDKESGSVVQLVPADEYNANSKDPYTIFQGNSNASETTHVVEVIGLEPATLYHFRAVSEDAGGLQGVSEDSTFLTRARLPEVRSLKVSRVQEHSAQISWDTGDVKAKGVVNFTNARTKATKSLGDPVFTQKHTVQLTDLEFGTRYTGIVTATNEAGDNVDSKPFSFITVRDVLPPEIAKVTNESTLFPGEDTKIQTILTWQTDEPSYCQVFYLQGLVKQAGDEGDSLLPEVNPVENHTQVIVGFSPGNVYKFWMKCHDEAGNTTQSEDYVLITPIREKNIIDIILENFQGTFGWVNKVGK